MRPPRVPHQRSATPAAPRQNTPGVTSSPGPAAPLDVLAGAADLLTLQRLLGNQHVQRRLTEAPARRPPLSQIGDRPAHTQIQRGVIGKTTGRPLKQLPSNVRENDEVRDRLKWMIKNDAKKADGSDYTWDEAVKDAEKWVKRQKAAATKHQQRATTYHQNRTPGPVPMAIDPSTANTGAPTITTTGGNPLSSGLPTPTLPVSSGNTQPPISFLAPPMFTATGGNALSSGLPTTTLPPISFPAPPMFTTTGGNPSASGLPTMTTTIGGPPMSTTTGGNPLSSGLPTTTTTIGGPPAMTGTGANPTPVVVTGPSMFGFGPSSQQPSTTVKDDDTDETSLSATNTYYLGMIQKLLDDFAQKTYSHDVSDSEDEEKKGTITADERRAQKAGDLAALASTMGEIDKADHQLAQTLQSLRKRDNTDRAKKQQLYAQDSREIYGQIGKSFKSTSLWHNRYLLKAFVAAVSDDLVKSADSSKYEAKQGQVRAKLAKILQDDHAKMKWDRKDFADDKTWGAVQFIIGSGMSNDSKRESYQQRITSSTDPTGATARMAFHHIAWKEAFNKSLSKYALNPANLTALNDLRELFDAKKIKALEAKGEAKPIPGAHDTFGHQGSGFTTDQKKKLRRSQGGGHFKDIDLEAVYYILLEVVGPRVKASKGYKA